jgi:hypothetical protein
MNTYVASAVRAIVLVAGVAVVTAADNPFLGTWKVNPAKSKFTGTTTTFEQTPSGEIRFSGEGQSYTFKTDGQEYEGPFGRKVTWTQADDRHWTTTTKQDGKVLVTGVASLSSDGKTMTTVYKGTKPNGEPIEQTVVMERVGGGSGLIGKWRSMDVKIGSPNTLAFEPNGDDGMTLRVVDFNITSSAKFDGNDYPATGPTVPANFTLAIKRKGARSFEMTQKQNGKPLFETTYTVSADGKTLTAESRPVGVKESITVVYDRQQ